MRMLPVEDDRPLPMEPVELVAIDLDGTLLRNDGTVSAASLEAVRAAVQRGVRVVLCTARPPRATRSIHRELGLDTLSIHHNGAVIADLRSGAVLHHATMPGKTARQIVDLARATAKGVHVGVEVLDRFITDKLDRQLLADRVVAAQTDLQTPFTEALQGPITKVVLLGEPGDLGGIQMELSQRKTLGVTTAYSHMKLLQVVDASVDKGIALAQVCQRYHVPRERVMAIGDAPNDLGMLRFAGLPLTPANAWHEVRKLAHFVVPSNEDDGVAVALRRYVLTA